jgi:hypothetical protein
MRRTCAHAPPKRASRPTPLACTTHPASLTQSKRDPTREQIYHVVPVSTLIHLLSRNEKIWVTRIEIVDRGAVWTAMPALR